MSWKDIIESLRDGESETVEFLTTLQSHDQIGQLVCGFLNQQGGKVIIGIDDKNDHLIGSNTSIAFIEHAIQKIEPAVQVQIEEINRMNKTVFLVKIPTGVSKPYAYRGRFYIRVGLELDKMAKDTAIQVSGAPKTIKLNNRQQKTLDFLNQNESITNRQFRDLFKVSHKTAHIELTDLVTRRLLKKTGQGRNTAYITL